MKVIRKQKNHVVNKSERYFLFTDGSYRKKQPKDKFKVIGLGADLRDSSGNTILYYSEEFPETQLTPLVSPNHHEQLALLNALNICLNEGIETIVIQTDSSGLAHTINRFIEMTTLEKQDEISAIRESKPWILNQIFDKIFDFKECFIDYIPRTENTFADYCSRSVEEILNPLKLVDNATSKQSKKRRISTEELIDSNSEKKSQLHPSIFSTTDPHIYCGKVNSFLKDSLFIKITDDEANKTFKVIVVKKTEDGKPFHNLYKAIHAPYTNENKNLVLMFLYWNLASGKSSINLLNFISKQSPQVSHEIKYSHNLWQSFGNMKKTPAFKYYKTFFFMSEEVKHLINTFPTKKNKSVTLLNDSQRIRMEMALYLYPYEIPTYFFKSEGAFKQVLSKMAPVNFEVLKTIDQEPVKPQIVSKPFTPDYIPPKIKVAKPAFSFLAMALEMQEKRNEVA